MIENVAQTDTESMSKNHTRMTGWYTYSIEKQ